MACLLYLHPLVISTAQQFFFIYIAGFTSRASILRPIGFIIFLISTFVALATFEDFVEPPGWVSRAIISAFPQISLTYFERMIVRKIAYAEDREKKDEESQSRVAQFRKRYIFGQEVASSMRGLGTPWEIRNIHHFDSQDRTYVPAATPFVCINLLKVLLCYFVYKMCITTQLSLDQQYMAPSYVPIFRRVSEVSLAELQVRYIATVTTVVSIFCFIQGGYSLASAASVTMSPKAVKDWRPIFGELTESYCLRQFWSTFWHQGLQNNLRGTATWIVKNIFRIKSYSIPSRYLKILLAFALSGLVHVPSDMGSAVSAKDSGAIQFFSNMISPLYAIGGLLLAYIGLSSLQLLYNYRKAKAIGLPVLITPIDPSNVPYLLCSSFLEPLLRKILPFGLGNFVEYNSRDWNYEQIHDLQERIGDTFIIVSPKQIRVFTGNAKASDDLCRRRRDFVKAVALYKPLEIFGRNVVTTEGDDWVRHRRITTPPFNERNSALVWDETKRQATDMLKMWASNPNGVVNPQSDTMVLALHVLTAAGFGRSYTFGSGLESALENHSLTYRDSLSLILGNLFTAVFTATLNLPTWMLPSKFKQVQDAVVNFRQYMAEMVTEEREAMDAGAEEQDNLMSILVRASENQNKVGKGTRHLTDSEIYGNLFSYNLAGHETTSNTLAYATILLAANPEWQKWAAEEVGQVTAGVDLKDLDYETYYPQLKRVLAIMHETLRLFGAARAVPKMTLVDQTLKVNGTSYTIPKNTFVGVNLAGLHTSSASWGDNALQWLPSRWITADEKLAPMPTGAFLPWAAGPRVCPGKKFSQVEFVAVMACLLKDYTVEPDAEGNHLKEAASRALMEEAKQSSFNFLLKVKHPEKIKLRQKVDNGEPIRMRLGNVHAYLIHGTRNVQQVFRCSKELTFEEFALRVAQKVKRLPAKDAALVAKDISGSSRLPLTETREEDRIWRKFHEIYESHLIGANAVSALTELFIDTMIDELSTVGTQGPVEIGIDEFMKHHMFRASTIALAGRKVFEIDPNFADVFWDYDEDFMSLLYGIPKFLCRKGSNARDKCLETVKGYLDQGWQNLDWRDCHKQNPDWEPNFGSKLVREREVAMEKYGIGLDGRASFQMGLIWSINSNAIPMTSWIIIEILRRPEIFKRIQEEAATVFDKNTKQVDIVALKKLPLLNSVYFECLRLRSSVFVVRKLRNSIELDGYTLKEGNLVLAPSYLAHNAPEVWSSTTHPPEEFWPERFIKKGNSGISAGNYFPYGGGAAMCPGRNYAKQEILSAVVLFFAHFEIEPLQFVDRDGKTSDRGPEVGNEARGVARVDRDLLVRLRRV
ncbi:cytochrome P450 monooxygenase 3A7 [Fusarium phyllophilum]|uniref:Cytochrome P450 monooxygenase 3A7 n=1 Tax=Fusarium phyllophilum TaxID=47803 RepID=A0A8H5JX77_9HYPO|nr:cytochrome P450 monooxygenase 3A7 [Fusarium phyllophilum]